MKFITSIILTALLAFVCCLYLPWWFIAVAAFLIAVFIRQSPLKAWLAGFIGIFFLWSLIAILKDSANDSILSKRVAQMFFLGESSGLLILVTGLIGAIVGGFAALTGSFLKTSRQSSRINLVELPESSSAVSPLRGRRV